MDDENFITMCTVPVPLYERVSPESGSCSEEMKSYEFWEESNWADPCRFLVYLVIRMYSIYERRRKILIFLLVLASVDYALQMAANHASTGKLVHIYQSVHSAMHMLTLFWNQTFTHFNLLCVAIYARSENPGLAVCFLVPTSLLYALVFISPTIFHHIVLAMTLFKSIQHIRATRAGGIKSIMHVVQRDQILFVLAICLINFANLVLVLQRSSWPYRLVSSKYVCTAWRGF